MKQPNLALYVPLTKVDAEKREVSGYATTEALDSQGEVVKLEAVERALGDYMKWANIREMHQPSAVGTATEANLDSKGLYITAKIVDDQAWAKVTEGVYKAFSIGGRKLLQKGNEILDLMLTEISLVDRPSNPEAVIDVWKRDIGKAESNGERSQEDVRALLYDALREWVEETVPMVNEYDCGYYIIEIFSDHFVASEFASQKAWSFPYTISGDEAMLGEPTEVKLVWETKGEKPTMTKMLGITPWWIKQYYPRSLLNKSHTMSVDKDKIKKDGDAPADEGQPKPEEKPEEKPTETPAEKPAEAKPEDKPEEKPADAPAPEEKPADKPADPPADAPTDKAATLSDDEKAVMKSAVALFSKLLGEAAPKTNEQTDVRSNIAKVAGDEVAKVVATALAEVAKANETRFAGLESKLDELTKKIQPVKARAGFVVTKGDEHLPEDGGKNATKAERVEALKKRAGELAELKKTSTGNEYQLKFAKEAGEVFTELRQLETEIGQS